MKYSEIIGVRPNFDDTFNIVQEKANSWKQFITNSQFEKNLSAIVKAFSASVTTDLNDRKSIWVQGTYGTGKSHSTSVIKHILCDEYEEIEDFVSSIYSKQLKYDIYEFRKNHRAFPVVLKGRYTIIDVIITARTINSSLRLWSLSISFPSSSQKTDTKCAIYSSSISIERTSRRTLM